MKQEIFFEDWEIEVATFRVGYSQDAAGKPENNIRITYTLDYRKIDVMFHKRKEDNLKLAYLLMYLWVRHGITCEDKFDGFIKYKLLGEKSIGLESGRYRSDIPNVSNRPYSG